MISRLEDAESDLCDNLPQLAEIVCNDLRFDWMLRELVGGIKGDSVLNIGRCNRLQETFDDIVRDHAQWMVDNDPKYARNIDPDKMSDDEIDRAADARDRARGL